MSVPTHDSRMKHTRPPSRSAKAKKNAKLAMTLSLGTLVVTGFMRSKTARNIHILSGAALIGACAWHNSLYQPSNRKAKG